MIGLRFDADLLVDVVDYADIAPLVAAEVVDQVRFSHPIEYAFRHPLIRTVAYESQLKSDRAQLHRRLAGAIEARGSADENAALIAQHLEAAGDLRTAFGWHMRAATWSIFRNFAAAHSSWLRARQVADRLPDDDPDGLSMRIAPRTLLCAHEYRIRSGRGDVEFAELKELCAAAGDKRSLAIGLAGLSLATQLEAGPRESWHLASELVPLLESIGDPDLTVSLSVAPMSATLQGGKIAAALQLTERVIELTEGKPTEGELITISPLASALSLRGTARWALGLPGWREDFDRAFEVVAAIPPAFRSGTFWHVFLYAIPNGVLLPGQAAVDGAAEIHSAAEQFGEKITVDLARAARGITLAYREGAERDTGNRLLQELYEAARRNRPMIQQNVPLIDIHVARERARRGDVDGAIELSRIVFDDYLRWGQFMWLAAVAAVFVESLLQRDTESDLREARDAIEKLAAEPTEPGVVLNEIWLLRLRALLARAEGDEATYREQRDRYRKMAGDLGFEGHMKWAGEMV